MAVKVKFVTEGVDKVVDGASKVGSALGGVSKIAGGFVLGSGILQAPGFLLGAAEAAAADEQASARLATTIKNLGGDIEGMTAAVNDRIDAGQKLAFSDDDVRDSFQYLAQATNDGDEALRRQKIAMDLARGANISLDQASKLLGKTSEENTNTLKKLGIEVAEGASEADVLAGVQARFAGQSEAYAKSTAGQFEQAKLAMGEIVEGIGGAVLPILTKVGTVLAANLPAIQAFVGEFGSAIGEVLIPLIQAFIDFLGPIIQQAVAYFREELLPAIQEFLAWLAPKLQELGAWIQEEFGKFKVYYESDIKPALDNIIAGVSAVIAFIVEHWPEIEKVIKPVMEQVANIVRVAVDIITGVLKILIDLIGGDFSGAWENLKALVGDVWRYIRETIENSIELIKALAPLMLEAGKALGGALMDGLKNALSSVAGFAGGIAEAVLAAVKGVINDNVLDPLRSKLNFTIPVKGLPDISIDAGQYIPRLADGGIVRSPTLALIGEAGPEAVIPLSSANARGGSLLGVGLGETRAPSSGGGAAGGGITNLSLAELKKIVEHTERTAKELDNQEGFLAAISKGLHSGSTGAGDFLAQIAEALEVLPEMWKFQKLTMDFTAQIAEALEVLPEQWILLRDIRDLLQRGQAAAFGTGA